MDLRIEQGNVVNVEKVVNKENLENVPEGAVYQHHVCQTTGAKWLCIKDIYQKFHRPNFYDIGGTYMNDVADFWFSFKTETVCGIFLLHLFVSNRHETSFKVAVSFNGELKIDKKNCIAYLPSNVQEYAFEKSKEWSQLYLTTYSYTELDVDMLKDRKMYISVSFNLKDEKNNIKQDIIDSVKVNHDFSALLADPVYSDFIIESAEGEKFKVHKLVLTAHSEVFKAMLKEDTAESLNGYVKLIEVSAEDVKKFLEFMYTGTIKDIDNTNFFSLLTLSDQYNLEGLRELSEYALSQQLTIENALDTLVIADMHNIDKLKQAALKFLKKNVNALTQSNNLAELKNVQLVHELYAYLLPQS